MRIECKRIIFILLIFYAALTQNAYAEDHRWSEWITDVQPSCTTAGHSYRRCDLYEDYVHYEEKRLPALGHDYFVSIVEPTCTARGVRTYTCSRCRDSYSEDFGEITPHQYEQTDAAPAGCDIDGKITYTCSVCGDTYYEIIPKIGHDFGEWITDIAPTTEHDGHSYRICKNDNHIEEKVLEKLLKSNASNKETFQWTVVDTVLTVSNISLVFLFAWLLTPLFFVLIWAKRKRKEVQEKSEAEK